MTRSSRTTGSEHRDQKTDVRGQEILDLYATLYGRVFNLCLRYLHHPADAEDMAQETFIKAVPHLDRLEGDSSQYILAIARNLCRDFVRHKRAGDAALVRVAGAELPGQPEDRALANIRLEKIWRRLAWSDRKLLRLNLSGLSYKEIARETRRSEKSVSVGLVRARDRARRIDSEHRSAVSL